MITKAIFLTGAAARISQEVALLDKLMEQKGLTISQDDTLLAGFSSGSLNLLALNGCFRNESPLSWNQDYKEGILFSLKNDDVFVKNTGGGLHIFDTSPLRKTLNGFLTKQGISAVKDFPFQSNVLTFSDKLFDMQTCWATNIAGAQNGLVLSDLFMASTAIPIVFPSQEIGNVSGSDRNFPDGHFSDGGTGGTFKNFQQHFGAWVLQQGGLDTMHIISPMRESGTAEQEGLVQELETQGVKAGAEEELGKIAANISFGTFFKFLEELQQWNTENNGAIKNIYVNIPRLADNFGILDFTREEEQYTTVCNWVDANPGDFAVPLDTFIQTHQGEA